MECENSSAVYFQQTNFFCGYCVQYVLKMVEEVLNLCYNI